MAIFTHASGLSSVDIFEYRDHFGFFCYLVYFQNNLNRLTGERKYIFTAIFKNGTKMEKFPIGYKIFPQNIDAVKSLERKFYADHCLRKDLT